MHIPQGGSIIMLSKKSVSISQILQNIESFHKQMRIGGKVPRMKTTRIAKYLFGVAAGAMLMASVAFAGDKPSVAEVYTGEDYISVYVRNVGEAGEASAQIGTTAADVSKVQKLSDGDIGIRTLVMIDNSQSIKKDQQVRISDLLQDVISQLMDGEKLCLATYDEEIQYLTDYTDNYGELKQALLDLQYEDQETYLTDVLYPILVDICENNEEDIFYRIIIISDGVDNKDLGVAKDVLYEYLKDHQFPIYTIGCVEKNNGEELENMFAISTFSGGTSYILDEVENTLDISNDLMKDADVLRISIAPPAECLDGSTKAVQLDIGGVTLQTDVRMPQKELVIQETESEPETESEAEPEPEPEPEPEEENNNRIYILIGIGVLVFLAVCIVVILVLIIIKSRKKKAASGFESFSGNEVFGDDKTDGPTEIIFGDCRQYQLTLEDVSNPAISYSMPVSENAAVRIGRDKDKCGICIDSDKYVSGQHCEIGVQGNEFYIRDLSSSNGTFINENRVIGKATLISGNIVRIGEHRLRVYVR